MREGGVYLDYSDDLEVHHGTVWFLGRNLLGDYDEILEQLLAEGRIAPSYWRHVSRFQELSSVPLC